MAQVRMSDIIILLPGITGSVLQTRGKDSWALDPSGLFRAISTLGDSVYRLRLDDGDDPDVDDLGDGVVATRVVPHVHLFPWLHEADGYLDTLKWLKQNFRVIEGSIDDPKPANLFAFPYDWRRHNAVAARALEKFVNQRLPVWQAWANAPDARVILLAHSMGGLVARYYVEVLGGWECCRALLTFGTPHRGSPNALDYLANGFRKFGVRFHSLTETMRTFSSVYELLPRYEMLDIDGHLRRPGEVTGIAGIDPNRASKALNFHRAIEAAVSRNMKDARYQTAHTILAYAGTGQPTNQSATTHVGKDPSASRSLEVRKVAPSTVDPLVEGGDGTVPFLSAIPIELSERWAEGESMRERHGALLRPGLMADHVLTHLKRMQAGGLGAIRGESTSETRGLSLDVEPLYKAGQTVTLKVRALDVKETPRSVRVVIDASDGSSPGQVDLTLRDEHWVGYLEDLDPGLYRVEARALGAVNVLPPVHGLFEMVPK
jgi:hypothetical protein